MRLRSETFAPIVAFFPLSTLLSLMGLLLISSTGCTKTESSSKPLVISTTGMIGDMVTRIGGDRIDSRTLLAPGVDPHLYKATQGDARLLSQAKLIFYNGLHLEGKMAQVLETLGESRPVSAVAEAPQKTLLIQAEAEKEAYDPHLWMDLSLWSQTLSAIEGQLSEFLPAHQEEFSANANELRQELLELDGWVEEQIKTIAPKNRVLVTAHDAFAYFGRRYGMNVLSLQGISTLDEASVQDVQGLSQNIVDQGVTAIFVESSIPKRTMEAVQAACLDKGHEVEFGGELYTDALGPEGSGADTYQGMIRHNVKSIVEALQ